MATTKASPVDVTGRIGPLDVDPENRPGGVVAWVALQAMNYQQDHQQPLHDYPLIDKN